MSGRWIPCYSCKEPIHLSEAQEAILIRNQEKFYCLWGHNNYFPAGPTEAKTLRRERDRLKQETARLEELAQSNRDWAKRAQRQASAARGQVTKIKNRVSNGVCPCCNRTFANLQRHMATKHAGFTAEEVQAEHGVVH